MPLLRANLGPEMAQETAAKTDRLSLIPGAHEVETENGFPL